MPALPLAQSAASVPWKGALGSKAEAGVGTGDDEALGVLEADGALALVPGEFPVGIAVPRWSRLRAPMETTTSNPTMIRTVRTDRRVLG